MQVADRIVDLATCAFIGERTAAKLLFGRVIPGKVRADHLPALAPVPRDLPELPHATVVARRPADAVAHWLAVAAGACLLERHLTWSRAAPGPDHAASLEPDAFDIDLAEAEFDEESEDEETRKKKKEKKKKIPP